MKRIEVSLNLGVVAPLLDFIKPVVERLEHETAFAPEMTGVDRELEGVWREGLIHTQISDCRVLMGVFDADFLNSGEIVLHEENADPILRAASAVRLKLREIELKDVTDAMLEAGEVEVDRLEAPARTALATYLFLATLQEIIIKHLGS